MWPDTDPDNALPDALMFGESEEFPQHASIVNPRQDDGFGNKIRPSDFDTQYYCDGYVGYYIFLVEH